MHVGAATQMDVCVQCSYTASWLAYSTCAGQEDHVKRKASVCGNHWPGGAHTHSPLEILHLPFCLVHIHTVQVDIFRQKDII